jgi:hypothetical protein
MWFYYEIATRATFYAFLLSYTVYEVDNLPVLLSAVDPPEKE